MNWKKLLKISALSVASLVVVLGGLGVWLLTQLPGPSSVKQALDASSAKLEHRESPALPNSALQDIEQTYAAEEMAAHQEASAEAESSSGKANKFDMFVLLNDFSNPEAPMVTACRDLSRAGESGFFPKKPETPAVNFFDSLAKPQKDPVIESIAPLLRYIFRSPGAREMIQLSEKAEGQDNLLQKAEFYKQVYRMANYLTNNLDQLNQVLQKSYNLHIIAKAVALNPQLANDNATMSFCEQIENSLIENQNLSVEEQVQEMQNFLQDSGIDAKSVGFNPGYRAHVQTEFRKDSFAITDSWLQDLVNKGLF
ncbi:hypothetical protein B9G69_014225 [Bdellovibrio sp. SKB1291214]|uniref:hypothetical protein n=1 Tax=Bdellovibrio sp. SKB1291214 TaxID=1732569 RepID=UPI000B51E1CB|nr:hypothetical protein [Bdellovibrio sp. SKB1291214]UYL08204.1 hypothetical protein B9G69_014225 [Bdellovibrio sp. SKB1291214]